MQYQNQTGSLMSSILKMSENFIWFGHKHYLGMTYIVIDCVCREFSKLCPQYLSIHSGYRMGWFVYNSWFKNPMITDAKLLIVPTRNLTDC
jgi:hypothetical protein